MIPATLLPSPRLSIVVLIAESLVLFTRFVQTSWGGVGGVGGVGVVGVVGVVGDANMFLTFVFQVNETVYCTLG